MSSFLINRCEINRINDSSIIAFLLIVASLVRVAYLFSPFGRIGDADEAVFGLMALAISEGSDFPIFCWGAHYAGAVVSYIGSLLFMLFSPNFIVLRSAMLPISIAIPVIYYCLCRKVFTKKESVICALYLTFPPFLFLTYSTSVLGGYGETFLGMIVLHILFQKIDKSRYDKRIRLLIVTGFMCGFFTYILFMIVPVIIAYIVALKLDKNRFSIKEYCIFLGSVFVGGLPLIIYNIQNDFATILRSAGRSFEIGRADMYKPFLVLVKEAILNKYIFLKQWLFLLFDNLGLLLMPDQLSSVIIKASGILVLFLIICFILRKFQYGQKLSKTEGYFYSTVVLYFVGYVLFQWVSSLDRPRHFLPILIFLPFCAYLHNNSKSMKKLLTIIFLVLYSLNIFSYSISFSQSRFDPYPITKYLLNQKIDSFFGTYDTVYPIMFVSKLAIIGAPYLRDKGEIVSDRTPKLSNSVFNLHNPVFVFQNIENTIESEFLSYLKSNNISYRNDNIDGCKIYYDLSKKVVPNIISNGENQLYKTL